MGSHSTRRAQSRSMVAPLEERRDSNRAYGASRAAVLSAERATNTADVNYRKTYLTLAEFTHKRRVLSTDGTNANARL